MSTEAQGGLASPPLSGAALPGNPREGSGESDRTCRAIFANRDRYGQVLWLLGDSIFRGYATGRFPDTLTSEEAATDPLWPFRSPPASMNLLCADLGLAKLDAEGTAVSGEFVACYAGLAGQPDRKLKGIQRISDLYASGYVREGDVVAFLDAGMHTQDPDLYEEQWFDIVEAAVRPGVDVILCNSFDYLLAAPPLMRDGSQRELYMYDLPFKGSVTGVERSHNQATSSAAARAGVRFLDAAALIEDWRVRMWNRYYLEVYRGDRLHLNPWGQMRLSAALFRAVRRHTPMRPTAGLQDLARSLRKNLNYRRGAPPDAPPWTREDAAEVVRLCHEEW